MKWSEKELESLDSSEKRGLNHSDNLCSDLDQKYEVSEFQIKQQTVAYQHEL